MLTCSYRFASEADDLVVTANWFAKGNGAGSDFVTGWNKTFDSDAFNLCTAHELAAGDQHIVRCVQTDS